MASFTNFGQAFELHFRCGRPLPEMTPCGRDHALDGFIDLDWSDAPATAPDAEPGEASFSWSDGCFHLRVPGVAAYRVTPQRIAVTPAPGADDRSIRAYLFGSATGALLQMRGITVLHGSAIALPDGGAAVFCGVPTAGKSTLAAALGARQHPLLADDITAVRLDAEGQAWCLPGLARTKLWRDALDTLGLAHRTDASTRVLPAIDKHSLRLDTGTRPLPLRRFYELQVVDEGALRFASVTGMAKLTLLLTHAYRPAYVQAMGLQPALLRSAAALARQLQVGQIVRPRGEATLNDIVAWLEGQWAAA